MEYVILIAAMGTVTYLPRWLPLFFLTRRKLAGVFVEWLELIPAAILAALLLRTRVRLRAEGLCIEPDLGVGDDAVVIRKRDHLHG